jgi:hypothetical protein
MAFTLEYAFGPCLGCDEVMALGTTGVTDFSAASAAAFTDLVARLTNGVDESLETWVKWYSGIHERGGSGFVPLESTRVGSPDLAGHTIEFIRREITRNDVSQMTFGGGQPGVRSDFSVRWTFYGDDPVQAPEPTSALLFSVGLLGVTAMRRRRFIR